MAFLPRVLGFDLHLLLFFIFFEIKLQLPFKATPLVPSKSYLAPSVYIFPEFSFQSSPHSLFSMTFNSSRHPKSGWSSLVFTSSQFPYSYQVEWTEALFLMTEVFFFHKGFLTLLETDRAIHCELLWRMNHSTQPGIAECKKQRWQ